jgi:transcriptional regulator GlxA family with amidase domain
MDVIADADRMLHSGAVTEPRRIAIALFDDLQTLDATGPAEVFSTASRLCRERGRRPYELRLASLDGGPVTTSSGIQLGAACSFGQLLSEPLDTLLVPGGYGIHTAVLDARFLAGVGLLARRARRVASVCTGTFALGALGLLDGRRATTHWSRCTELAERFPAVDVVPDAIYVRDGTLWSSAGVTAGMDLALALVEDDLDAEVAREVARWLVLFLRRPGGQSQFSTQLRAGPAERQVLRELQAFAAEHPEADLSLDALARRAHLSARHLSRLCRRELGQAPGAYVEAVRIEAARRLLETTRLGVDAVASRCGLGSAETLRRAFLRTVGVTPSSYRARFQNPHPAHREAS